MEAVARIGETLYVDYSLAAVMLKELRCRDSDMSEGSENGEESSMSASASVSSYLDYRDLYLTFDEQQSAKAHKRVDSLEYIARTFHSQVSNNRIFCTVYRGLLRAQEQEAARSPRTSHQRSFLPLTNAHHPPT